MTQIPKNLPKSKQDELNQIISTIKSNCDDVEKIILFGSYARGDYKEEKDLDPNRKSGHVSDYDILVVTSRKKSALDTQLWFDISKKCRDLNLSADPRILTHDIDELNRKLSQGQYFYKEIIGYGISLFDTNNYRFSGERKLTLEERKETAEVNFEVWFESAEEFFIDYNNALERGSYKKSAFYLNQSVENCYKTILLVFINYIPNEHRLNLLETSLVSEIGLSLKNKYGILKQETEAEQERFKLLDYAYIGARYDIKYKISKEDLEILAKDVEKLLQITKELCEEKIKLF